MALKDMMGSVKSATEGMADVARDKMGDWVEELKKANGILEALGFRVSKFTIAMGALPEVHSSVSGSMADVKEEELRKLAAEHVAETLLVSALNALITARKLWEHVELKNLNRVTLNMKLGVPPKVDVEIH